MEILSLLYTPVQILPRDMNLSTAIMGELQQSSLGEDFVKLVPFKKGSPESKTWPGVGNPFHIRKDAIQGIFELKNTNDKIETTSA